MTRTRKRRPRWRRCPDCRGPSQPRLDELGRLIPATCPDCLREYDRRRMGASRL